MVLGATAVALLVLLAPSPAGAHASLTATSPADGAALDTAPTEVRLSFSENVTATVGAIRVLDRDGERVDRGSVEVDGSDLVAPLEELSDGSYVVAWRVVSADSHPIHGSFTFVVGDGDTHLDDDLVASLIGDDGDGPWRATGVATRAFGYGGSLLAVGLAAFVVHAHDGGAERSRLRRLLRWAAGIGSAGLVLEVPVRAALATGLGPSSITETGVLEQVLGDRVGIGLSIALLSLLFVAVDGGRDRIVSTAAPLALGGAWAVAGHTATTSPAAVAFLSDAVHVAAAAVWFGGLVGCATVASARHRGGTSPAAIIVRFSSLAGVALAGVAVGGLALAWGEVRSVDGLVSTPYGRLVMGKVAVVGLVAALGGYNRYRLVPVLEHDLATNAASDRADRPDETDEIDEADGADGTGDRDLAATSEMEASETGASAEQAPPIGRLGAAAMSALRTTLAVEAGLLVAVIAVTALLVDVTPARAAVAPPFEATEDLADGEVQIYFESTRAGTITLHVYAFDDDGAPLDPLEPVDIRFSLPSADVVGLERTPEVTGSGHWTLITDDLTIAGTWTVEVAVRLTLYDTATATFEVPIRP